MDKKGNCILGYGLLNTQTQLFLRIVKHMYYENCYYKYTFTTEPSVNPILILPKKEDILNLLNGQIKTDLNIDMDSVIYDTEVFTEENIKYWKIVKFSYKEYKDNIIIFELNKKIADEEIIYRKIRNKK